MDESLKSVLALAQDKMGKALSHLEVELRKIRAGKASPMMLDNLKVDYYGTPTPISQVAAISTSDARTLTVKPWEKNMISPIEKAIQSANLGLNPQNDGDLIRIVVPKLTEDRRKDLVKQTKTEGESAKVSVRSIRKDCNQQLKELQKGGVSEDMVKNVEQKIQDFTNDFGKKIDDILKLKEEDIMTV